MTLMRPLLSSFLSWLCLSPRPLYCMRDVWQRGGGERESKRRGWGAEVFFVWGGGVKADLEWGVPPVSNYQSLRNAAAAFTRQAAARLQRPRSTPTCITLSTDLCAVPQCAHTHTRTQRLWLQWVQFHGILGLFVLLLSYSVIVVYFYHCHYRHGTFLQLYPFSSKQRDHIMSVRDCLSVQVLRHCVFMLICWYENQIVGNILVLLSVSTEKRRLLPLDMGNLSWFPDFKVV